MSLSNNSDSERAAANNGTYRYEVTGADPSAAQEFDHYLNQISLKTALRTTISGSEGDDAKESAPSAAQPSKERGHTLLRREIPSRIPGYYGGGTSEYYGVLDEIRRRKSQEREWGLEGGGTSPDEPENR